MSTLFVVVEVVAVGMDVVAVVDVDVVDVSDVSDVGCVDGDGR